MCASGLSCDIDGTCRRGLGEACDPQRACVAALVCDEGTCLVPIAGACTSNLQCASGWCREDLCAPVSCGDQLAHGEAPACERNDGVCSGLRKAARHCRSDGLWSACTDADYAAWSDAFTASPEQGCDARDNDCDGRVDEGCAASVRWSLHAGGLATPRVIMAVGQAVSGAARGPSGAVTWGFCGTFD